MKPGAIHVDEGGERRGSLGERGELAPGVVGVGHG